LRSSHVIIDRQLQDVCELTGLPPPLHSPDFFMLYFYKLSGEREGRWADCSVNIYANTNERA